MPTASVNGVKLYYEIHGSGEPVLCVPGLGSDVATWGTFVEANTSRFQFILAENRGSPRSSKPAGPYRTETMSEDLAGLLEEIGIESAHVIGKSMGGMIAQFLAANHPEKVHSLVLASSLLRHDDYGAELLDLALIVAQKAGLFQTYRQAFLLSYSREYCMTSRTRLQQAEALLERIGSEEMVQGYLGQCAACKDHDSTDVARAIKAPTLVIVGRDDIITTAEQSRQLAAAIPGAELVVHPRGGHGFWREFAAEIDPIVIDFLAQHPM